MQGLHRSLMSLLKNHHTSCLTCQPSCKRLNQGKKPFTASFTILDNEKILQLWGNAFSSRLKVAIQTCPHPEKHCIISWWLMLSPPCGPSVMNHMNYLFFALKRCDRNWQSIVLDVLSIIGTTEIQIPIDIVREVSKSLETPSNVVSGASLVALHTTWPSHQGSWFLVVGFSWFALQALLLEALYCRDFGLQHLHSTFNPETPPSRLLSPKSERWPHDNSIVGILVYDSSSLFLAVESLHWWGCQCGRYSQRSGSRYPSSESGHPICRQDIVWFLTWDVFHLHQCDDALQLLKDCSQQGHSPIPPICPK